MSARDLDLQDSTSLVVTGSSAGGIEALTTLVQTLPANFPAPIVLAQHLDPRMHSRLPQIIGSHASLPVRVVGGGEQLEPGAVYVVPSGSDVEIADGHIRLAETTVQRRSQPSIDRLFTSAALAYGERLIAVILTGMGSDGLDGAREVKKLGGTVIIQDPATASYPSMPLALAPNLVDIVARLEDIGPLLHNLLLQQASPGDAAEQNALRAFLTQLRDRSGIDFLEYKMPTIRRRLARLMAGSGTKTFHDYLRHLQQNPEAYQRLVRTFLIKVTEFFRDPPLFEYLHTELLPQLIAVARERGNELRLWSAGCATGEEAYSLAVLVADLLRETDSLNVRIFATDLDEEAIAFARRGRYPRSELENVPPAFLERYFVRVGETYEVGKRIRNMTVFGQHDLAHGAPFPRIDLAFCRNVLIYFTKELQQHTLQLFAFSVRDGGYLVLGKAESTSPVPELFKPRNAGLKVFCRQGERVLAPPARPQENPVAQGPRRSATLAPASVRVTDARPTVNEIVGGFIFNSAVGIVVVDRHYDILTINNAARGMLNIHGVGIGEDLVHLARSVDSNVLRESIDAALRNEAVELGGEMLVRSTTTAAQVHLQIVCYPDKSSSSTRIDAVAIVLVDVTRSATITHDLRVENAQLKEQVASLSARVEELTMRQRALLEANDELTSANVDLRSVNEQLLIQAEEAASATEEIETLNEEMQATNEELETLNEELQATVEELNTTNDELEARGAELEASAREHKMLAEAANLERDRVDAIFSALELPVASLTADGSITYANAAFYGLKGLRLSRDGTELELDRVASLVSGDGPRSVWLSVRTDGVSGPGYAAVARTAPEGSEQACTLVLYPLAPGERPGDPVD